MSDIDYDNYFMLRGINIKTKNKDKAPELPGYYKEIIPKNKKAKILDIGCGLGYILRPLKQQGYMNLKGIDLSQEAVTYCRNKGIKCIKASAENYLKKSKEKYDLILINHVLEHIPKNEMIETVKLIYDHLEDHGQLFISVPNAQSNTGCYWMYDDFTHVTLFTAASLQFVLKSGGFTEMKLVDPNNLSSNSRFLFKRIIKIMFVKTFLSIYKIRYNFWNKVTGSFFCGESPVVFTMAVKMLATK